MQAIKGTDILNETNSFLTNYRVPSQSFNVSDATNFLKSIGQQERTLLLNTLQEIHGHQDNIEHNYPLYLFNLNLSSFQSLGFPLDRTYDNQYADPTEPQISVFLMEHNNLPIFYKASYENVPDISIGQTIAKECKFIDLDKTPIFVTDQEYASFFDQSFFNQMGSNFLCKLKLDSDLSQNLIATNFDEMLTGFLYYDKIGNNYYMTVKTQIELPQNIEQIKAYNVQDGVDTQAAHTSNHETCIKQDVYAHLICNSDLRVNANNYITCQTMNVEYKHNHNKELTKYEENFCKQYLIPKKREDGYILHQPNIPAQRSLIASRSWCILISNAVQDPILAYSLYKNQESAKASFNTLSNFDRFIYLHKQEELLEGKLYIFFVALYMSRLFSHRLIPAIERDLLPNKSISNYYASLDTMLCSKAAHYPNTYVYTDFSAEVKDIFNILQIPLLSLESLSSITAYEQA